MEYKSVKGFSGWAQLGFICAFLGFGFVLAAGIQFLFVMQILPAGAKATDPDVLKKAILAPENVSIARVMQVLATFVMFFIPAWLWSRISNGKAFFWLGFNKYVNIRQLLLGFLIIFAAAMVAGPLSDLTRSITAHFPSLDAAAKRLEEEYNTLALAMSRMNGWGDFIIGLFIMCFFPAIFEEALFRGCIQNFFTRWWKSPWTAIILTSVLFSLTHMSVYLFLSRLVLGIALGIMYHETKNIWVNIIAHFINNAIALSVLFSMRGNLTKDAMEKADPHVQWWFGLIAIGVIFGMFMFLKRFSSLNKARIEAKENLLIAEADPFRSFADKKHFDGAE